MKIVIAKESHIPEIISLWEEFARFHEPLDPRYPMKDDARVGYEIHLREEIDANNTRVLVVLDDDRVVGYVMAKIKKIGEAWKREKYGYIEEMAVTADSRRHGIGSRLLEEILDWFKSEDIEMIEVSVAAKNIIGNSFWNKHGFKVHLHRLYLKL